MAKKQRLRLLNIVLPGMFLRAVMGWPKTDAAELVKPAQTCRRRRAIESQNH